MKILVYGAGPLGSIFASLLKTAGHEVSLLARGKRLEELRENDIIIENFETGEKTITPIDLVEHLQPQDAYDLIMVIMRKNKALEILPTLAANHNSPNILFMMNNAAGPDELTKVLGKDRVLIGFPYSAGMRDGPVIRALIGSQEDKIDIPFGEVDGTITARTRRIAEVLNSMPGYQAEIRVDMDAWLKTHVALLMTSIAPALYAADTDLKRLANTPDLLVLAWRAVLEGFQILRAAGIPITPAYLKRLPWIPEPLVVVFLRKLTARKNVEIALAGHARVARDEVAHLANEFMRIARSTTQPGKSIERLLPYLDSETPCMPEGSAALRQNYAGFLPIIAGLVLLSSLAYGVIRLFHRKNH